MSLGITLTGADERTPLSALRRLVDERPALEIGLLYTATPEGRNRYPSQRWLEEAAHVLCGRCALHVCGRRAREMLRRGLVGEITRNVNRIQINGRLEADEVLSFCHLYAGHGLITQYREPREAFPSVWRENHAILVDQSGGRGLSPEAWKRPATSKRVGFAGGLGPDNLREQLPRIASIASGEWWIDLESGLRDSNDWFDVQRCMEVLDIVRSWEASERKES